jgi:hypothetical protein
MTGFNDSADDAAVTPRVRPYTISGGSTHSRRHLGPGIMVRTTTTKACHEGLVPELQDIVQLCRTSLSLIEIATVLAITLRVVDVLVDDLCARGLVTIDHVRRSFYRGRHRLQADQPRC